MSISYSFAGRVVLITGASSGIGAETAVHFAAASSDGLALTARDEGRLEEVGERCQREGLDREKVLLIVEDMASDGGPDRIMDAVLQKFGKLDILVNNAGQGGLSTLSDPDLLVKFDNIYALNVRSTLHLSQLAVPHLIKTKGNIVTVSSICSKAAIIGFVGVIKTMKEVTREFDLLEKHLSQQPLTLAASLCQGNSLQVPNMLAYNLSKAALDYFTESAARCLAAKQVRVNSVNPGSILTPLHTRVGRNMEEVKELAKKIHPLGRIGESEEVAKAIMFLASDHSSYTTGETLAVDGGRFLLCP